jgi:Fic family protein
LTDEKRKDKILKQLLFKITRINMKNYESYFEKQIIFPQELTEKDKELILQQCENQQATSKEQIEGFANAYLKAKRLALAGEQLKNLTPQQIENLILELGEIIEERNKKGFRQVPVTFKSGKRALEPEKILQAIKGFCLGFEDFLKNPVEDERVNINGLYKEFEEIHPFEDGNGRVGHLLWAILKTRKENKWPEELPPKIFSEE